MKKIFLILFVLISTITFAQNLETATPESVGMSSDRLKRIDATINEYINKGWIPGAIALVIRDGKIIYHQSFGYDDTATKTKLQKDAIVRLASQTKAITSTAVMMLYEDGKLLLDDPISKYIPAFKAAKVLDKFNEADTTYTTVPAKREVTIRDLLTHTSGIGYAGIGTKEANAIYAKNNIPGGIGTPNAKLTDAINALAKLPLMHQPAEKWTYGLNTDVLGYLVEVISGQTLDVFFQEKIFKTLGMTDTYFYLPEAKFNRLPFVYTEDKNKNSIKAIDVYQNFAQQKGTYFSGGAGLSGTALDYAKFLQMMLNGGKFNNTQLLSPAIVRMMTTNQIGNLSVGYRKFGLGFALTTEQEAARVPLSEGSFEWGGIFGTSYWADPKEKIIGLLMTQKFPNSYADLPEKYKVLVYQALVK